MELLQQRLANLSFSNKRSDIDHLKFVVYGAVLYGFRTERVLKPYPESFRFPDSKEVDVKRLRAAFERISIKDIDRTLKNKDTYDLVDHILNHGSVDFVRFTLRTMEDEELFNLLVDNISKVPASDPTYIFKILTTPKQKSYKNERFQELKQQYGTFFAFHGTKLQNLRSIFEYGLLNIFYERQLYGDGIYMANNIFDTFTFAPFSKNFFADSIYGSQLSSILVCEVIKHSSIFDKEKYKNVPKNYYIVSNSDWIRLDSLLLYDKASLPPRQPKNRTADNGYCPDYGTIIILSLLVLLFATGYIMTRSTL